MQSKSFDWTYTTQYAGVCSHEFHESNVPIDVERLKRRDPILFFDQNILFEDELADNGASLMTVKLRVMPTWFVTCFSII